MVGRIAGRQEPQSCQQYHKHQHERHRRVHRLTIASRQRLPLQERCNLSSLPPLPQDKPHLPCPTDPVPDDVEDFTELWKAVDMAKLPNSSKSVSSKGTAAYDDVLYCLGINIEETSATLTEPKN